MKMDPDVTGNLSVREVELLQELKTRVAKEHGVEEAADEYRLRRFLKAREFDVDKAEAMLRNNLVWRKKNQVDTIRSDFHVPEIVKRYFPLSKFDYDEEGLRFVTFNFGNIDIKGLLASCKKADIVKATIKSLEEDEEYLRKKSKEKGRAIEKWYYICDFENFTFAQATYKEGVELLLHLLNTYEANYPERLHTVYAINASLYFTILFAVAKPVLSGETLKKIQVYGKDGWKEELQKLMPIDVLPAYLGGKRTDPNGDPMCPSLINHGGIVPKCHYLTKIERSLSKDPGFKQYTIQRMSKTTISLQVDEPGSRIEWEFETENHDISFGISYTPDISSSNLSQELVPMQRVDTRYNPEEGVYTCVQPGIYSLVFDNTFSWFRQKHVFCRAHIVNPKGRRTCITN